MSKEVYGTIYPASRENMAVSGKCRSLANMLERRRSMNTLLWIILVGILVTVFSGQTRTVEAMTAADVARGNTTFAWDLYARLRAEEGNLFFSPYSISLALAMTYAGARGETAAQMANTLHFPGTQDDFHPALAGLNEHVRQTAETGGIALQIANSLWPNMSLRLLESFLNVTRRHYQANLFPVDFAGETEHSRQKINAWVADNTMQKIPELLLAGDITAETVLALVNAIYFKGTWDMPFKPENTADAPFITPDGPADVPMMSQRGDFEYAEDERLQVLSLPYTGRAFSMIVFLPRIQDDLTWLETALDAEFVMSWIGKLHPEKVNITLPKFTLRQRFSLLRTLETMGMRDLADFSGMAQPSPGLSKIIHEAYVDVNEEGTEAAAATAVVMGRSLQRFVDFIVDHPFVFCLVDGSSDSILFIGRVMNPGT